MKNEEVTDAGGDWKVWNENIRQDDLLSSIMNLVSQKRQFIFKLSGASAALQILDSVAEY